MTGDFEEIEFADFTADLANFQNSGDDVNQPARAPNLNGDNSSSSGLRRPLEELNNNILANYGPQRQRRRLNDDFGENRSNHGNPGGDVFTIDPGQKL